MAKPSITNNDLSEPLLEVNGLQVAFFTRRGVVKAIDGVSFSIGAGEVLGLVGETGSGKTVTALSLIGMVRYPGRILDGEIWFRGEEWLSKPTKERVEIRGNGISMIFQNAKSSLNPLLKVRKQIIRAFRLNNVKDQKQAESETLQLMGRLGMPDPQRVMESYPHELSGGMAQRVVIATAMACHPALLIADEPTTALDVTTQAEILRLIRQLRDEMGISILLITHDLGVIAATCDRVAVMHAGHMVEEGTVFEIFEQPLHPYTKALLKSVPRVDRPIDPVVIHGDVPDLVNPPSGCRFVDRCPDVMRKCHNRPPYYTLDANHRVMCFLYEDELEEKHG